MGYEEEESILGILEKRLEKIEEEISKIRKAMNTNKKSIEELRKTIENMFKIRCPNCGNPIDTRPIPYFVIKAIHGADASPLETRGIGVKRGLYGPQTDWLEHVIKCKKCGYEYHIIYW